MRFMDEQLVQCYISFHKFYFHISIEYTGVFPTFWDPDRYFICAFVFSPSNILIRVYVCVCVCKAKRIFLKIKRKAVAERKERKCSVYFMSYIASMSEICLSFSTTTPAIDEFIIFLHLLPLLPGLPYIQFRFSFFRNCTALMMTTENVHIELKSNKTK